MKNDSKNLSECPRCLFTDDIAKIGEKQCNYCDLHDKLERLSISDFAKDITKIRNAKGKYNCLIGISGGLDSSTLLYWAVKNGLKPLVIHFDNHWNTDAAKQNMQNLIQKLSVDSITYTVNKNEYDRLNDCFLRAGTPDCDIPNDIAMTKLMYDTAVKYKIKYILNGHDFRTEGSTPVKWTYMDAKYIKDVYLAFSGMKLENFPLLTFKDQLYYGLKGIKNIRPFYFLKDIEKIQKEMKDFIGWADYGKKHQENIYTDFIGSYVLPIKFGINKQRVYLSAQIRSGNLTKEKAVKMLNRKNDYIIPDELKSKIRLLKSKIKDRNEYDHYDFKKYKWIIWILAKMKVIPITMYVKYCKSSE